MARQRKVRGTQLDGDLQRAYVQLEAAESLEKVSTFTDPEAYEVSH